MYEIMASRSRVKLLPITLLLMLLLSPAASAMNKEYYNFWEIAECPDEQIEMEGSVRFQYQETGMGWVFQAFWTGDAWGLDSGAQYSIQGKWMEVVKESPPYIFLWNDHFQLIGKGQATNYSLLNKIKVIVDASGNPRVEFDDYVWPCPTIAFEIW